MTPTDIVKSLSAVEELVGLQIIFATHAADMRGFGFGRSERELDKREVEWWLHILCSWRLESERKLVTGSFDWFEPALAGAVREEWDPARGGSLQEMKLRELFKDRDSSRRTLTNHTDLLVVQNADVNQYGDVAIVLTGGFNLRIFPAGSRGEFWRIFKKGDLGSHCVFEIGAD